MPEIDIENPESSLLDLDDSAFENELLDDEEQELIDDEEQQEEEVIENVDWDEANREVEDFINESGIDDVWDTDSDIMDR